MFVYPEVLIFAFYLLTSVTTVLHSDTDPWGGGVLAVGGGHCARLHCETKLSRFCCIDIAVINRHFDS